MQPGVGDGVAADPARLRAAAGAVAVRAADVTDAVAAVRGTLGAAGAASGGPRLSAALAAFEQELTTRTDACAEALRAAATELARTAEDLGAADRFPTGGAGPPVDRGIRGVLG